MGLEILALFCGFLEAIMTVVMIVVLLPLGVTADLMDAAVGWYVNRVRRMACWTRRFANDSLRRNEKRHEFLRNLYRES